MLKECCGDNSMEDSIVHFNILFEWYDETKSLSTIGMVRGGIMSTLVWRESTERQRGNGRTGAAVGSTG